MNRNVHAVSHLVALAALLLFATLPARPQSLIYHSGRVLHHPRLHVLYWSSDWDSMHSDPQFKRANIDNWLTSFVAGDYFDKAGQYDSFSGSFQESNQSSILAIVTDPGSTTDSLAIHVWLTAEIEIPGTGVPYPCDDDDVYVVLLPKGTKIDNIVNQTCDSFGAYHLFAPILIPPFACGLSLGGVELAPYVIIPVDCATHAAGPNGFFTDFDSLTELLSHEIVEACTDPIDSFVTSVPVVGDIFSIILGLVGGDPGWYDSDLSLGDLFTKSEAADICEFPPFNPEVWLDNSIVAAYWSNADGAAACGPGLVKNFTLNQTGVTSGIPVPVTFDTRTPDVNAGGGFTIQVATNTSHSYAYPSSVSGGPGARFVTSEPPATVNVTDNFSKTAAYTAQFFVTVSTNPAAAAVGDVSLTPSGWFDAGSITIATDLDVSVASGTRYNFTSWGGDISATVPDFTFTLSTPINAVANYALQHLLTVNTNGLGANTTHLFIGGALIGTASDGSPFSNWFNDGTVLALSADAVVLGTGGIAYFFQTFTPAPPAVLSSPVTTTAIYETMDQLINDALASGGIYGPGANGIANSLHQKWAQVTAKLAAGQDNVAQNLINAFINEVQAQTGKHITSALSATLQSDAMLVLNSIP